MTNIPPETLALTLYDIGAIKFGDFQLHSGQKSHIYLDLRLLVSYPQAMKQVAEAYRQILEELHYDVLAAYPYAALPIGCAISLNMGEPLIYPRKEVKNYGTGKSIEGVWQKGQRAIIIEDLITSGTSIIQAIATMKAAGLQVNEAVVLIDRQQGGREVLAADGYQVHAVMTISEILGGLEKAERISPQKRLKVLKSLELGSVG